VGPAEYTDLLKGSISINMIRKLSLLAIRSPIAHKILITNSILQEYRDLAGTRCSFEYYMDKVRKTEVAEFDLSE
jgi:hypothetical protein